MLQRLLLTLCIVALVQSSSAEQSSIPEYDRGEFGRWIDHDSDCLNTRHELLAALSTGALLYSDNGCRVLRGRWIDPYTDAVFMDSSDLDVDHLVPLHWAWQRGAWSWTREHRVAFANDPINLIAVDDGTNRSKGANGPLDWLPPNDAYQCQYVLRFWRVSRIYNLEIGANEQMALEAQREKLCS
ncbi:HNH endonuclease family protein [Octadecabacter sp.]|nr:HNH endonuclease family protein [Octadecabacter sp.]